MDGWVVGVHAWVREWMSIVVVVVVRGPVGVEERVCGSGGSRGGLVHHLVRAECVRQRGSRQLVHRQSARVHIELLRLHQL